MRRALVLALALAGCGDDSNGAAAIDLTLIADHSLTDQVVQSIRRLDLQSSGAETSSNSYVKAGLFAVDRQERVVYYPGAQSGALTFSATAWDGGGNPVAFGQTSVELAASGTLAAQLVLTGAVPSFDLAGADFAGADLAGADLAGADLAGTDLAGFDLAGTDLAGTDLAGILDSDGDTISDHDEGADEVPPRDTDGDGTPDYLDLDSDNDCISDAHEAGDADLRTPPVDTDGDGVPDFRDSDSDGDGLPDVLEDLNCDGALDNCESSRLLVDTDGDGVSDLLEYEDCVSKPVSERAACACDAVTPGSSPLTRGDLVFTSGFEAAAAPASETAPLSTDTAMVDAIFAVDTTGSMMSDLSVLSGGFATIASRLQARVPSVAFGVLDFKDFAEAYVVAYDHRVQTVATAGGIASLQNALNGLTAGGGGDGPEAGWEALYAIGSGPAISVSGYNSVLPLASTPPDPPTAGETQGTIPGAGFRANALPIVVTLTDAEWHDAPGSLVGGDAESGLNVYNSTFTGVPSRRAAVTALQAVGARVVGLAALGSGQTGDPKARALALATETSAVVAPADFGPVGVRPSGCAITDCCTGQLGAGEAVVSGACPLALSVNDSTGAGIPDAVSFGVIAMVNGVKYDVHVAASDVDAGAVDGFIASLQPNLSGAGAAAACLTVGAGPIEDNYTGPTAALGGDGTPDTLPGVGAASFFCVDVIPKTNAVAPNGKLPQTFRARLTLIGSTGATTIMLGTRDVLFVVPAQ
jgi:Pentapeptide repeats (8 copies)